MSSWVQVMYEKVSIGANLLKNVCLVARRLTSAVWRTVITLWLVSVSGDTLMVNIVYRGGCLPSLTWGGGEEWVINNTFDIIFIKEDSSVALSWNIIKEKNLYEIKQNCFYQKTWLTLNWNLAEAAQVHVLLREHLRNHQSRLRRSCHPCPAQAFRDRALT